MSALLYAYALLAMASSHAPVTLNVDVANGATLAGERSIKVTVVSDNPVTQVEFYVGTDLRDNATATPYLFKFDSLPEADGDLKLRFKAYTTEGETGEKTILVHIDNGIAKGADYHVQKGLGYLTTSNWRDAETEGRIAIKIDPKSNAARIVLTRAFLGERAYDKAQKFAEDAVAQDGKDVQALNLLAAVNIELALRVVAKEGGDRKEVVTSVREALKSAVTSRRKVLDDAVAALETPTDEASAVNYANVAIAAGRYNLAERMLTARVDAGGASPAIFKRLAYTLLREFRFKEAADILQRGSLLNSDDPDANAILAVAYAEANDVVMSDAAIARAKKSGNSASGRTAEAYIALKFARSTIGSKGSLPLNYDDASGVESKQKEQARTALSTSLNSLLDDLGERTESNYFAQSLENKLEDYDKANRYFESAILAEPANVDAFIEQGNRSLALSYRGKLTPEALQQQYDAAETMFQTALASAPSSASALAGLSIVNTIANKPQQAVTWAEAAVSADKNYAAGFAVLCSAYNLASKSERAQADALRKKNLDFSTSPADRKANETQARVFDASATKYVVKAQAAARAAEALEPRIQGYDLTSPVASWRYFYAGGRSPVIAPPAK